MNSRQVALARVLYGDEFADIIKMDGSSLHVERPLTKKALKPVKTSAQIKANKAYDRAYKKFQKAPVGNSKKFYAREANLAEATERTWDADETASRKVSKGFNIAKMNEEKQQVYGWASITKLDGEPVVDLQGDYIHIDEVRQAAHHYLNNSRKGGVMHQRDGEEPRQVGHLIESVIVDDSIKKALGMPDDTPEGWFIGMQVTDDETWENYKNGKYLDFSVHGRGKRVPIDSISKAQAPPRSPEERKYRAARSSYNSAKIGLGAEALQVAGLGAIAVPSAIKALKKTGGSTGHKILAGIGAAGTVGSAVNTASKIGIARGYKQSYDIARDDFTRKHPNG